MKADLLMREVEVRLQGTPVARVVRHVVGADRHETVPNVYLEFNPL